MSKPTDILNDEQRAELLEQLTGATPDAGRIIREALSGEIPIKSEKLVDLAGDLLDRVGVPKMKYQTVEHQHGDISEDAAKYLLGAMGMIAQMMGLKKEADTIKDVTASAHHPIRTIESQETEAPKAIETDKSSNIDTDLLKRYSPHEEEE